MQSTGCDDTAPFILTNGYLRKNPNMTKHILSKFKSYQKNRLDSFPPKQPLSKQILNAAQDKRIVLSPQHKLLIEAIVDTIESNIYDTDEEGTELKLTDITDKDSHRTM